MRDYSYQYGVLNMIRSILLGSFVGLVSFSSMAQTVEQRISQVLQRSVNFVPRVEWGATEISPERAASCGLESDQRKTTIVISSTGDAVNTKGVRCPQIAEGDAMRRLNNICGPDTHFFIAENGTIYQGSRLSDKAPLSVSDGNLISITLAGCFSSNVCNTATNFNLKMENALIVLLQVLSEMYGIELKRDNVMPMSELSTSDKYSFRPGDGVTDRLESILFEARAVNANNIFNEPARKEL
jgi:N-acetylmuramoyl-L-alanine amidase